MKKYLSVHITAGPCPHVDCGLLVAGYAARAAPRALPNCVGLARSALRTNCSLLAGCPTLSDYGGACVQWPLKITWHTCSMEHVCHGQ